MKNRGFTLIELMIVVAVIGILAALALPAYQDYVAKSQVTGAMAELSGAKTRIEDNLTSSTPTADAAAAGLTVPTERCSAVALTGFSTAGTSAGSIACTMKGGSQVNGKSVTLTRNADDAATSPGAWTCSTDAPAKVAPKTCQVAAASP